MKTLTPLFALAAALTLLPACTRREIPTQAAAPDVPATKQFNNVVTISAQAQKDSGVVTATIAMQALPEVVRSTARLTNDENQTWRVGAIAEGRIVRVKANSGDAVVKDQLLAQMHSHDIHESRASYKKATADHARLKGVVDYATKVRDRAKRLYDLKAGSLETLERTETELNNAHTDVRNAEVEVDRTRSHLTEVLGIPADEADIPHSNDGEDDDLIPVLSPATGIVLTRNVTQGTVVTPSNDLFLISDLSRLWAMAEVKEEYLGKLRVGMPVRIQVQAYANEAFWGKIGKLGEALDPATRTVKVRVDMPNPKGRLKPEMYATTEIELGRGEPAVLVAAEAVQDVRGQSVVFVRQSQETFEVRPVSVGRTLENSVEVVSGLKPGEEIATHAAFVLKSEFLRKSMGDQ